MVETRKKKLQIIPSSFIKNFRNAFLQEKNNNYDQIGPLSFTATVVQATVVVLC